jgi:hypothetical protein
MIRISMLLALSYVVVGCGGNHPPTRSPGQAVATDGNDTVCKTETPTGSHIQQTRCYDSKTREQDREAARRALQRP